MDEGDQAERNAGLQAWARQHEWGQPNLMSAFSRSCEAFKELQREAEGQSTRLIFERDAYVQYATKTGGSASDVDRHWAPEREARHHLSEARKVFPGLAPVELSKALETVAAQELDGIVADKLREFNELFWPYALALAWLATGGDEDRLRSGYETDLRSLQLVPSVFEDDRWNRLDVTVPLTRVFGLSAEEVRSAETRLIAAAKAGSVCSVGLLRGLAAPPQELRSAQWVGMTLYLDPGDGRLRFMNSDPSGAVWCWIKFSASDVRALLATDNSRSVGATDPPAPTLTPKPKPTTRQREAPLQIQRYLADIEKWKRGELAQRPIQNAYARSAGYSDSRFSELVKNYKRYRS